MPITANGLTIATDSQNPHNGGMILSLNCAHSPYSLCLWKDANTFWERSAPAKAWSMEKLSLEINAFLSESGASYNDLSKLIVTKGPGSYTSLRLGITTLKTIAQVKGTPILGVDTLEAIARTSIGHPGLYFVVLPGRKGDVVTQLYSVSDSDAIAQSDQLIWKHEQLLKKASEIEERFYVIGALPDGLQEPLKQNSKATYIHRPLTGKALCNAYAQEAITEAFLKLHPSYAYMPVIGGKA